MAHGHHKYSYSCGCVHQCRCMSKDKDVQSFNHPCPDCGEKKAMYIDEKLLKEANTLLDHAVTAATGTAAARVKPVIDGASGVASWQLREALNRIAEKLRIPSAALGGVVGSGMGAMGGMGAGLINHGVNAEEEDRTLGGYARAGLTGGALGGLGGGAVGAGAGYMAPSLLKSNS